VNRRSFFGLLIGAVAIKPKVKPDTLRSVFTEIEHRGLYSSQFTGSAMVFERRLIWDEIVSEFEAEQSARDSKRFKI
jgi:hypothetical protein